jgi:uncharacterized MnhB-related membrane protein
MSYDDNPPLSVPRSMGTNDDACVILIGILSILMIVIALPSMLSQTYASPLPAILALGFTSIVLSLIYLARQARRISPPL